MVLGAHFEEYYMRTVISNSRTQRAARAYYNFEEQRTARNASREKLNDRALRDILHLAFDARLGVLKVFDARLGVLEPNR